jgi:hypothetical protein
MQMLTICTPAGVRIEKTDEAVLGAKCKVQTVLYIAPPFALCICTLDVPPRENCQASKTANCKRCKSFPFALLANTYEATAGSVSKSVRERRVVAKRPGTLRLRPSQSKPKPGPVLRIYAADGEALHPVHRLDGTLQLCGEERYPVSRFGPQHGLTPEQVRVAEALWHRAQARRPIDGSTHRGRRLLNLRRGGIISAIRRGTVGNHAWGRSLQGHRGGRVTAMHNLATLWANGAKTSQRYQIRRQLGIRGH